ncbi:ribonuclease H-like domain-containing protein, partial [Tanacetum coccineum]
MSLHGYSDGEYDVGGDDDNVTLITKHDVSHPLHLHPNDSVALTVVSVRLKGTENYQVWSCAMLLALEGKNKTGFIDGSFRRSNTDEVLGIQWDRANVVVLGWIINSIYEELFVGQIFSKRAKHVWDELKETYDKVDGSVTFSLHHKIHTLSQYGSSIADYYHNSILSREVLPDFRSAYAIISSEESHRVASGNISESSQRSQTSAFSATANMIDSGANQHITFTDKFLVNVIDISHLKIKVSHPNGTDAFITKIGNMPLTGYLTLFDVLVFPEYCISLMSVYKVARDSKLVIAFDELKCYILNQDLKTGKVLGTSRQFGGLYYFDGNQ